MASRCDFPGRTIPPFSLGDIKGFPGIALRVPKLGRVRPLITFNADLSLSMLKFRGIKGFELKSLFGIGDFALPKGPRFGKPRALFTFNVDLTLKRPTIKTPDIGDLLGFLAKLPNRPPISLPPCFLDP